MSTKPLPGKLRLGRRARHARRDTAYRLDFIKTKSNYGVTDIEEHKKVWTFGCMDPHCTICRGENPDFTPF